MRFSLETVIALLAPHVCVGCGAEGEIVCAWCMHDEFERVPSRCYRCKRLTREFRVCPSCRSRSRVRRVWVATPYEGIAEQLIRRYKFARARAAAVPIAHLLDATLPHLPSDTLITFVPTATRRVRQRGYDHAELIAKEFAGLRSLSCKRLVTRTSQARQVGATRHQRQTQLRNAFLIVDESACRHKNVLVIDDVVTTGATVEAVAAVLRMAGARHVDVATFAQKI